MTITYICKEFVMSPLVFPWNYILGTSGEIHYWWCVTTQISVLSTVYFWLLVPWGKFASTNQKHYPNLGSGTSSVWNSCGKTSGGITKYRLFSQANICTLGLSLRFQVAGQIQQVRGSKQLGVSFGSTFLLFSFESSNNNNNIFYLNM